MRYTPDDIQAIDYELGDDMTVEEVIAAHYEAWHLVEVVGTYGTSDMQQLLDMERRLDEHDVTFQPTFPVYYT